MHKQNPEGFPLLLPTHKTPQHPQSILKKIFGAASVEEEEGAATHGAQARRAATGRWGGRGPGTRCGARPGERGGMLIDLQTLELIGCCLQPGFIAQLLINCFRI